MYVEHNEEQQQCVFTQFMKYAWVNFTTSNVTSKLIGMRLLKRMMKVKKFSPKLLAPPSIGGGHLQFYILLLTRILAL